MQSIPATLDLVGEWSLTLWHVGECVQQSCSASSLLMALMAEFLGVRVSGQLYQFV